MGSTNAILCDGCERLVHKKCSGIKGSLLPDSVFSHARCLGTASVTLCFVQLFMSGNNDNVCKMLLKNRGYHFFNFFPMTV